VIAIFSTMLLLVLYIVARKVYRYVQGNKTSGAGRKSIYDANTPDTPPKEKIS